MPSTTSTLSRSSKTTPPSILITTDNDAAKRVAERCGYPREGVLRMTYLKQGIWVGTEIWSGP